MLSARVGVSIESGTATAQPLDALEKGLMGGSTMVRFWLHVGISR